MIITIFIVALVLLLITSRGGDGRGGGCVVRPMPTKPKPNIPPPAQRK